MDMHCVHHPPVSIYLSPQVYSMKSFISININGNVLHQPKLMKDTIRLVLLYYVETHKRHNCPPHILPRNTEGRKVA